MIHFLNSKNNNKRIQIGIFFVKKGLKRNLEKCMLGTCPKCLVGVDLTPIEPWSEGGLRGFKKEGGGSSSAKVQDSSTW